MIFAHSVNMVKGWVSHCPMVSKQLIPLTSWCGSIPRLSKIRSRRMMRAITIHRIYGFEHMEHSRNPIQTIEAKLARYIFFCKKFQMWLRKRGYGRIQCWKCFKWDHSTNDELAQVRTSSCRSVHQVRTTSFRSVHNAIVRIFRCSRIAHCNHFCFQVIWTWVGYQSEAIIAPFILRYCHETNHGSFAVDSNFKNDLESKITSLVFETLDYSYSATDSFNP